VPPCTALMAWALFGETFTAPMMLGMALTVVGVAIVVRNPRGAAIAGAPQEELCR
jgi:drug/metabolite transporter (DMT)-like permease